VDLEIVMEMCGYERRENTRYGTVSYVDEAGSLVAKTCRKCKGLKERHQYWENGDRSHGVQTKCKDCMREERATKYREYILNYAKGYYREHIEDIKKKSRKYVTKWQKANPEKVRLAGHRRQARKRALPDTLTVEQTSVILERFGGCVFTGSEDFQLDHVIPLAVGHGGTTKENMVPLRSDLNMSKSNRNIFEWFASNKERFNLDQTKFDELIEYLANLNEMTVEEYRDYVYWCHENPRELTEDTAS
jgi:hypothetical protein